MEGAGDTLAGLYEQLNAANKSAFGTTGKFAAGQSQILDEARAAIARANEQITKAQATSSDPALVTTNAALEENNDQNVRMIHAIEQSNLLLSKLTPSGGGGFNLAELAHV